MKVQAWKERAPQRRSGAGWRWLWFALALVGLALAVGAAGFGWVVRHYSEGLPSVERLKSGYDPPQVSRIYARDGTLLSSVFTERRTVVPFADVPRSAKLAFLAAEDAYFYQHQGLNYLGVLRAMWANLRAGHAVQGGSTITQQVVKNILLDSERSYRRKVRESILARRLEQYLTKDEIFGLYLNHIYLGHGRYGVEEAARFYFGKHARQLTTAEAALLAGVVSSPERYSPRRDPAKARVRQHFVLDQMLEKGFITPEYHAELIVQDLPRSESSEPTQAELSPEMVQVAKNELQAIHDSKQNRAGYDVVTTLDPALQLKARQAVRSALAEFGKRHKLAPPYRSKSVKNWGPVFGGTPEPNRIYLGKVDAVDDTTHTVSVRVGTVVGEVQLDTEERYNPERLLPSAFTERGAVLRVRLVDDATTVPVRLALELGPEAALVAIDSRSREVRALVGSQEGVAGGLDRARQARRQPGSSFKPFVYSYVIHSRAVTPATVLALEEKGHGVQEPPPYSMSVRNALAHSNNEASEQLLKLGGPSEVVAWAHRIGIQSKLGADLSLALGSYEVTPLELANAYATFASGGFYAPPRLVREIRGADQQPIGPPQVEPTRVISPQEAYMMTSLMRSVVDVGTGRRAQRIGHPIAAKTGTSNDSRDAWFVGYSPELVCAVWVGYDDAIPLGADEEGARTAAPAFVDFMTAAHAGKPVTEFPRPPGIVAVQIDPATGMLPRPGQLDVVTEEFLEDTVPETWAPEPATEALYPGEAPAPATLPL
jgi:penicillin-binding protein 1A